LKLAEGKYITHAVLGFEKLSQERITELYGSPPLYKHL
jgi:hypothetical protein